MKHQSTSIFLSGNIKFLRNRLKQSQQELADNVGITRSQLASYEAGNTSPSLEPLMALAAHFHLTIDTLLTVDLGKIGELQLRQLESGEDIYISGGKLRVLATTVDTENRENIELVPIKARAGYTAGYNDPEFVRSLPVFQLPFLSQDRKYRSFQIEGDSMLPIKHGSYVIGEFVQNWRALKDGEAVVVITKDEGAVFKIIFLPQQRKNKVLLKSLNPLYEPYEVDMQDIFEVWKFKYYFSAELPDEPSTGELLLLKLTGIEAQLNKQAQA